MYCAWVCLSALTSLPQSDLCTRNPGQGDAWVDIIGFFIAIAAVCISTTTISTAGEGFGFDLEDGSEEEIPYRPEFFHLMFALGSAYLAMVFTAWSLSGTPGRFEVEAGSESAWIKIVT